MEFCAEKFSPSLQTSEPFSLKPTTETLEQIKIEEQKLSTPVAEHIMATSSYMPFKNVDEIGKEIEHLKRQVNGGMMWLARRRGRYFIVRRERENLAAIEVQRNKVNELKAKQTTATGKQDSGVSEWQKDSTRNLAALDLPKAVFDWELLPEINLRSRLSSEFLSIEALTQKATLWGQGRNERPKSISSGEPWLDGFLTSPVTKNSLLSRSPSTPPSSGTSHLPSLTTSKKNLPSYSHHPGRLNITSIEESVPRYGLERKDLETWLKRRFPKSQIVSLDASYV